MRFAYAPCVSVVTSGHELTASHDCATVGCPDEAAVQLGSLWYCRHHAGPIPKDAGRASRNGSTAEERRELARKLREEGHTHRAIAEQLGVSLTSVGNYLTGTLKGTGARLRASEPAAQASGRRETRANGEAVRGQSFEFRAAALVELGRKVDQARAELGPAQAAYEEACRRWQEAVERLPAANGLLTNGLAQAVTTGEPDVA
jgi:hypothetical protein